MLTKKECENISNHALLWPNEDHHPTLILLLDEIEAMRQIVKVAGMKTYTEKLLELAELKTECPAKYHHIKEGIFPFCMDKDNNSLPDCGSTGKVPRFPRLRRKCICIEHPHTRKSCISCYYDPSAHSPNCSRCQGRGWIPVDDLEATLSCAFEWRFETLGGRVQGYCRLKPNSRLFRKQGKTYNEAAIAALYEARKDRDERMKLWGMCVCGHIEEEHDSHGCVAEGCGCAGFEVQEEDKEVKDG